MTKDQIKKFKKEFKEKNGAKLYVKKLKDGSISIYLDIKSGGLNG